MKMKRMIMLLIALLLTIGLSISVEAQEGNKSNPESKVELTEAQQKELAEIHEKILEKKVEMIEKHVEFGIITKEKGEKIKEKLNKRFEMMKENGFVPNHDRFDHSNCHENNSKE